MHKTIVMWVFFAIVLFITLYSPVRSDELDLSSELLEEIENSTLRPYFNALKSGNVNTLEHFISGNKRKQAQLPQYEDKEYQDLLRRYYKGAVFTVERAVNLDNQIIVDILIKFPGKGQKLTRFYLQDLNLRAIGRDKARVSSKGGGWVITDEQQRGR